MPPPDQFKSILQLEELTLNTAPAIHQGFYDGWVLRASGTDTRRANAVTALQASTLPLDEKIAYCEAWYHRYGQPAIFRLTDAFSPPGLDAALAARGYSREVETLVRTLDLAADGVDHGFTLPPGAKIVERSEADGLRDVHLLKHASAELMQQDAHRQMLWRGTQVYASLKTINGLAATGMARVERDHVGIFAMRTAERARRKGYASMLVSYLLGWAAAHGARTAFLQVDAANTIANRVYDKFGFAAQYAYWHRVAPRDMAHGLPRPD
jgi:GNAT superfamily N-acetyltransferase